MASFKAAVRQGIEPDTFWELTPYQTQIAMSGLSDGRTILAWQMAVLSRAGKMPKLDKLLSKDETEAPEDHESKMKRLFKEHNARIDNGRSRSKGQNNN